ncbi:MAG: response regulator transcription factor [Chloroflexi bacterium]|nr:response regulator transcription factor [Chloroflexota bacterium]
MLALILCEEADETALLGLAAQRAGLTVQSTPRLDLALRTLERGQFSLIVAAPRSGALVDATRRLRLISSAPLAVISPSRDEDTLCRIYDAGADEVLTRPYSARLLIAQLRALLRRGVGTELTPLPSLQAGDLHLIPATRTISVSGREPLRLTPLEFRLLYTLMTHPGQTIPTETLIERVWGYEGEGSVELARGLISRLRSKIERNPREPELIVTVSGVGYLLAVAD